MMSSGTSGFQVLFCTRLPEVLTGSTGTRLPVHCHTPNYKYRKVPPERPTISPFRGRIVEVVCCLQIIRHEPCTHIAHFAVNPYLKVDTSSTQKPAKCDLSTLRFSHRTHFVALCHTIFLSLAVKSRWGALARRGALAVLYGNSLILVVFSVQHGSVHIEWSFVFSSVFVFIPPAACFLQKRSDAKHRINLVWLKQKKVDQGTTSYTIMSTNTTSY